MSKFPIGIPTGLKQIRRSFRYTGRSTRSELLSLWLVMIPLALGLHVVLAATLPPDILSAEVAVSTVIVVGALPWAAIMVRRLHDENRSGWWLSLFVGFWILSSFMSDDDPRNPHTAMGAAALAIGFMISIAHMVIALAPATYGPNDYGQDPRLENSPDGTETSTGR